MKALSLRVTVCLYFNHKILSYHEVLSLRLAVFYGDFSTDAKRITQSFVGLAADVTSNLLICAP